MFVTSVIAMVLILVGAINYGSVGFFNYNFLSVILGGEAGGEYSMWAHIVFALIGLSGLWGLSFLGKLGCFLTQNKKDS